MRIWNSCIMKTSYEDESRADEITDCEVRISDEDERGARIIVVSYSDDNYPQCRVIYKGGTSGHGFSLKSETTGGTATLALINNDILAGEWKESGWEGFWKIELDNE